jgi:hypothetical protein
MSSDDGGSHDHIKQSWDDFVAPLVELEVAICEQDPDVQWLTQRPFFVVAYRIAAQLRAQAESLAFLNWRDRTWADPWFPGDGKHEALHLLRYQPVLRPDLTGLIPTDYQWENEGMRREGEAEAELQPHQRWSPDFRTYGRRPEGDAKVIDELRRLDLLVNKAIHDLLKHRATSLSTVKDNVAHGGYLQNCRPLRFEIGQRVLAVCDPGKGTGVHDDWSYDEDGSRNPDGSLTRSPCTVVWRCLLREGDIENHWLGLKVVMDDEEPSDIFYQPYQLLRDDGDTEDRLLIFAPADHDICVRAMTAEEEEMYPQPPFNRRISGGGDVSTGDVSTVMTNVLIPLLMRRWWSPALVFEVEPSGFFFLTPSGPSVMSPCYNEVDIGGLLDVHVEPGTIGRGLVDLELYAGVNVCHEGLLPGRVHAKLFERINAIEAAEEARNAELEAACVIGGVVRSWWWATEGTPCDDDGTPFYECVITAMNADGTYGIQYFEDGSGTHMTPPTTQLSYTNAPRTSIKPLQDDSPLQKVASAEAEASEDGASETGWFERLSAAEKLEMAQMLHNKEKGLADELARYRRDGRLISYHDGKRMRVRLFSSWLANHVARLIAQCFFSHPPLSLYISPSSHPHHRHGTPHCIYARIQTKLQRRSRCDALALPVLRLWALCRSEGNAHASL